MLFWKICRLLQMDCASLKYIAVKDIRHYLRKEKGWQQKNYMPILIGNREFPRINRSLIGAQKRLMGSRIYTKKYCYTMANRGYLSL